MPYQQPVIDDGNEPPEARKTPDILTKFPFAKLKRRSSSNYKTALLSNKFEGIEISKVSPTSSIENSPNDIKDSPFKSGYTVHSQDHHHLVLSPTLSPDEDNHNDNNSNDNIHWSSEGAKRSRQRASIDLSSESIGSDLNVDYEFAKKYYPDQNQNQNQNEFQGKELKRRESSVYHSNQIDSQSQLNINEPINIDDRLNTATNFEYNDFKRRMQHD